MRNDIWIIADPHLNHTNIIRYTNRPFNTVEEMNETIIFNWNNCVKQNDSIFVLGDFFLGKYEDMIPILERLNGMIYIISGNHDNNIHRLWSEMDFKYQHLLSKIKWIKDYHEEIIDGRLVVMFHYPLVSWNRKMHKSYHLWGHTHGVVSSLTNYDLSLDVGVDATAYRLGISPENYRPLSWQEINKYMNERINIWPKK